MNTTKIEIEVFNQKGEKVAKKDLPEAIFGVEVKKNLIHQALKLQLANIRNPIAHTQTKGEVRGGGRKPFRQKGTGNARQGSTRNPHMKGGGVAFGPRNVRNFTLQMPKQQRRKALFMALSVKAADGKIFGLDQYTDEAKTKTAVNMIKKMPITRNVLFVMDEKNPTFQRASNNLSNAKTILVGYLNIRDLQKYDSLCFIGNSIEKAQDIFLKKSN